jgi:hypothetical protein
MRCTEGRPGGRLLGEEIVPYGRHVTQGLHHHVHIVVGLDVVQTDKAWSPPPRVPRTQTHPDTRGARHTAQQTETPVRRVHGHARARRASRFHTDTHTGAVGARAVAPHPHRLTDATDARTRHIGLVLQIVSVLHSAVQPGHLGRRVLGPNV